MENKTPQNASEFLEMIYEFIYEDEDTNKPVDVIEAELKKEGVDTERLLKRVSEKIEQFKAKSVLAQAHTERQKFIEIKLNDGVEGLKDFAIQKKEEFSAALEKLCGLSKDEAMVYCRKFKEGNIDDLNSLLEDFKLLNKLKKDKDVGPKN